MIRTYIGDLCNKKFNDFWIGVRLMKNEFICTRHFFSNEGYQFKHSFLIFLHFFFLYLNLFDLMYYPINCWIGSTGFFVLICFSLAPATP